MHLQPEYKRDYMNSYMLLPMTDIPAETDYRITILTEHHITGLLDCHIRVENEQGYYYYEVTGKKTIRKFYEHKKMDYGNIKNLMIQMRDAFIRVHEHLLDETKLVLEGDMIFVDLLDHNYTVVLYPDYHMGREEYLGVFSELLLELVDYEDEKAVEGVYFFYEAAQDDNFSWEMAVRYFERDSEISEPELILAEPAAILDSSEEIMITTSPEKGKSKKDLPDKTIMTGYVLGIAGLSILFILSVLISRRLFNYETAVLVTSILGASIVGAGWKWRNHIMLMEKREIS